MTQQILLLGVDMDLSPATQAMLQVARSLLLELAPQSRALLLTIIPVPYDRPSSLGRFRGQAPCLAATLVQRSEARHTVQLAQAMLVQGGIASGHLETQVREGVPAEELVKVASVRQVACIVLGYRGAALRHRLRRLLLVPRPPGPTDRMKRRSLASCPNTPAVCPSLPQRRSLPAFLPCLARDCPVRR